MNRLIPKSVFIPVIQAAELKLIRDRTEMDCGEADHSQCALVACLYTVFVTVVGVKKRTAIEYEKR